MINDYNFIQRKQLLKYINHIINFYTLSLSVILSILWMVLPWFYQGLSILLIMSGSLFLSHNFFWQNWILYNTVNELNKFSQ